MILIYKNDEFVTSVNTRKEAAEYVGLSYSYVSTLMFLDRTSAQGWSFDIEI